MAGLAGQKQGDYGQPAPERARTRDLTGAWDPHRCGPQNRRLGSSGAAEAERHRSLSKTEVAKATLQGNEPQRGSRQ